MLATILAAGNGIGDTLNSTFIHDSIVWGAKIGIAVVGLVIVGLAVTKTVKWGIVFGKVAVVAIGCAVIAVPFLWTIGAGIATKL